MKVFVVGSGGREHALCWKIAQSPLVRKLFCAPGNAGIAAVARCEGIAATDVDGLVRFARRERMDLTVVGPEAPLAAGLVDRLSREGLKAFGPTAKAAEIESSKAFAKSLMRRHGIPSADFQVFSDPRKAMAYVSEHGAPVVVKADGLCAGKGVTVASTEKEALEAIEDAMVRGAFGDAGKRIIIEEKLEGEEASILALTDGKTIATLPSAQDHKRVGEGDIGPNTGGMGAYSPAPVVTPEMEDRIVREILVQTIHAMNKEDRPFVGVLYAGLMIGRDGPAVLEFNARFGDPETQAILPLLSFDLVEAMMACVEGKLDRCRIGCDSGHALTVVLASEGYPGAYAKGKEITGLEEAAGVKGALVFHAGTVMDRGKVLSNGGRVLNVTGVGSSLSEARDRAYEAAEKIRFEGVFFRRDIGWRALGRGSGSREGTGGVSS
ncbi:MAG: phosphoribosylamine--glycine ligase [Planctomycetota bacterium]|nr:phosphoribosylamine--glycine ligase [Planctomycetota bacterium]